MVKDGDTIFGIPVRVVDSFEVNTAELGAAECLAPPVKRDPDCDHDSNPVDRAIYIIADNLLKHFQTAKHWDCSDSCWLEAVEEAKKILNEWKESGD